MEVCVGDVIEEHTSDSVLRGHGTMLRGGSLVASRCGQVQRWNQLVLVEPLSGGYTPAVGHVVVGRIVQVRLCWSGLGCALLGSRQWACGGVGCRHALGLAR